MGLTKFLAAGTAALTLAACAGGGGADGAGGQQSCTDRFSESVNIPASHVLATFLETNQEGNAVYNLQNTDGDERGTCEVDSSGNVVNLSLGG